MLPNHVCWKFSDALSTELALAALGLKTGGTVQQRAVRLFLTKNTPLEKLDKKHFAKGSRVFQQNGTTAALQQDENSKEIALMEAKMQ
ncbi:splicing factor SF3a60 homolog [Castanea sativa]|uniref:splicing factor SF3a60 homolog n=1 Tax=Castanea sativa TaxID=21020 RepID=UPI003F650015